MSQDIWKNLKYKNVAVFLAIFLLVILIIASSCSKGSNGNVNTPVSTVAGGVKTPDDAVDASRLPKNSDIVEINNNDYLYSGNLILVNEEYEYADSDNEPSDLVSLYGYHTNNSDKIIFSLNDASVSVKKEYAAAVKKLANKFYKSTKNDTLLITSGYRSVDTQTELYNAELENTGESSTDLYEKPRHSEHHTGLALDLGINTEGYPTYDGSGDFSWITEHMSEYGIITRYTEEKKDITKIASEPWHLRYVGVPHAQIITEQSFCLEEYIDYLKGFSYDKPLMKTISDGTTYGIYFVSADKEKTKINLPLNDSGEQYPYEISGNNVDGFVITVNLGTDYIKADDITPQTTSAANTQATQPTGSDMTITTPSTTTVTPYISQ